MKIEAQRRFWKDIDAVSSKSVKWQALQFIDDVEELTLAETETTYDFKPLRGQTVFYRVRIGDYRLGCRYDQANDTLLLMRLLHREEIYRNFP